MDNNTMLRSLKRTKSTEDLMEVERFIRLLHHNGYTIVLTTES